MMVAWRSILPALPMVSSLSLSLSLSLFFGGDSASAIAVSTTASMNRSSSTPAGERPDDYQIPAPESLRETTDTRRPFVPDPCPMATMRLNRGPSRRECPSCRVQARSRKLTTCPNCGHAYAGPVKLPPAEPARIRTTPVS